MDELDLNNLDKNKKTAVIYSLDDLFVYIVKVHYLGKSYYIGIGGDYPEKFANIDDAKRACRKHKVDEAYLALSNAYQEFDLTTDNLYYPFPRYDYHKICL